MVGAMTDYMKLKESVLISASKERDYDSILSRLKEVFGREINSQRRSEHICSVADLLQVLEKRNELAEDNVVPLKMIAAALRGATDLEAQIAQYDEYISVGAPSAVTSYYGANHHRKQNKSQPVTLGQHTSSINIKKKSLIYETIANEIGSHWRDLARSLEIREGQIQKISLEYKDYSDKVTRVLELSEHKSDPQRWFYQLCDALESARRKDLRKSLQEIIMMNV